MGSDYSDLDFTGCPDDVGPELLKRFEDEHDAGPSAKREWFIEGMVLRFTGKPKPECENNAQPTSQWYGWVYADEHTRKHQVS